MEFQFIPSDHFGDPIMDGLMKTITIGDLGRIITGKTPPTKDKENYGGDIPFITPVDMTGNRHVVFTERYITSSGLSSVKNCIIPEHSICVSCIGSDMGKTVITAKPSVTNQQINSIIVDERAYDYLYVYYLMRTLENKLKSLGKNATAVPILNKAKFSNIDIIVFKDIEKQKAVSCILSAYDSLIETNQRQIKLLEEAAQRLYKEWFVDLRFPGHEDVPVVDGVPEGWKKQRLEEIAVVIMGQSPKSEFYNLSQEGLPFHQGVGSYGYRFVIDETYSTSFTRIAPSNSILFSVRAPVGRLNITKNRIVIGRGLAALNHRDGMQSFLFYLLKDRFFKEDMVGNGSIFASISKDELLGQAFLIPSHDLITRYNQIASHIDEQISALDTMIKLQSEARNRLLPKLMSGEIAV